jgi:hypothetical protein
LEVTHHLYANSAWLGLTAHPANPNALFVLREHTIHRMQVHHLIIALHALQERITRQLGRIHQLHASPVQLELTTLYSEGQPCAPTAQLEHIIHQ